MYTRGFSAAMPRRLHVAPSLSSFWYVAVVRNQGPNIQQSKQSFFGGWQHEFGRHSGSRKLMVSSQRIPRSKCTRGIHPVTIDCVKRAQGLKSRETVHGLRFAMHSSPCEPMRDAATAALVPEFYFKLIAFPFLDLSSHLEVPS